MRAPLSFSLFSSRSEEAQANQTEPASGLPVLRFIVHQHFQRVNLSYTGTHTSSRRRFSLVALRSIRSGLSGLLPAPSPPDPAPAPDPRRPLLHPPAGAFLLCPPRNRAASCFGAGAGAGAADTAAPESARPGGEMEEEHAPTAPAGAAVGGPCTPSQPPPARRLALISERAFGPRLSHVHACVKLRFRPDSGLGDVGNGCCGC